MFDKMMANYVSKARSQVGLFVKRGDPEKYGSEN